MNESEIKSICAAAMLEFDEGMMASLSVIERMMDAVADSDFATSEDAVPASQAEPSLRTDTEAALFTREEMLANAKHRRGEFVIVPRVV